MADARVSIQLRISPAALAAVDKRAADADRARADVLRSMLAYAEQHMPRETRIIERDG